MKDDAELETGTQELQTVDYSDFLDPFLPSGPQKEYFQVPEHEKKALTAELKISYRARTCPVDASQKKNIICGIPKHIY